MTAHDLHHVDDTVVIHIGILADLHAGGGDELGGASETGAVIRTVQVVVHGLGHTDHAAGISHRFHIPADLVAGVHGVIAAVIEEVAHVVLFEDLQDPLVVRVIHLGIRHLVAAGAQFGGRGVQQKTELLRIFLIHYIQTVRQNALDAVGCTVDLGDLLRFQSGLDHAVGAGIDHGGGTAGLAENAGSDQFFRHSSASQFSVIRLFPTRGP